MTIRSGFSRSSELIRSVSAPQDILGETPLWCDRTHTLFWLDIDSRKLQHLDPITGRTDTFLFDCRYAGSLALTTEPNTVLIGLDLGLHLFDLKTRQLRPLCQVEPADLDNRLNDGRCDAFDAGLPLYFDSGHLSQYGSQKVGAVWLQQINELASHPLASR